MPDDMLAMKVRERIRAGWTVKELAIENETTFGVRMTRVVHRDRARQVPIQPLEAPEPAPTGQFAG